MRDREEKIIIAKRLLMASKRWKARSLENKPSNVIKATMIGRKMEEYWLYPSSRQTSINENSINVILNTYGLIERRWTVSLSRIIAGLFLGQRCSFTSKKWDGQMIFSFLLLDSIAKKGWQTLMPKAFSTNNEKIFPMSSRRANL